MASPGTVLLGVAGGVVLGLAARTVPALAPLIEVADVVGTVFINGIRMVVMPLVVGLLIEGLGSHSQSTFTSSMRGRVLAVAMMPLIAAIVTMAAAMPLFAAVPVDPAAASSLRASMPVVAASGGAVPSIRTWFIDLVPANIFKAAADGALLPVIVWAVPFALAVSRLADERRRSVTRFFGAIAEAMLAMVRWIIAFAPVGVLALTAPLVARLGGDIAGLVLNYVFVSVGLTVAVVLLAVYPMAAVLGRVPLLRLARACVPAQSLAITSRSSIATLPAMMDAARSLDVPETVVAVATPLAASLVRVGAAVGQMTAVVFAAHLFGITLGLAQQLSVLLATVMTSMASPGVPGGSIIVLTPVLASAGIPAEALGIILGADAIPDMARTMANVTGAIAATVIVAPSKETA